MRNTKLEGASLNGVNILDTNLDGAHFSFQGETVIVGHLTPDEWEAVQRFREVRE